MWEGEGELIFERGYTLGKPQPLPNYSRLHKRKSMVYCRSIRLLDFYVGSAVS